MSEKHLTTEDFDYDLPESLIAQTPLEERDQSRMLILDSKTGEYQDDYFYNVIDQLNPGDALVMNDSRVMPARIYGVKPETGGHVEVLLLNNTHGDEWETLVKPARRAKVGTKISFGDGALKATVTKELEHGGRLIEFEYDVNLYVPHLEQFQTILGGQDTYEPSNHVQPNDLYAQQISLYNRSFQRKVDIHQNS